MIGYAVVVIAQTIVLPIVSGAVELAVAGGDPLLVFAKWWVFWGVGTRLLLAGLTQVSGKGATTRILGGTTPSVQETQLTRELGSPTSRWGRPGSSRSCPGGRCLSASRARSSSSSPVSCT